MRKKILTLLFLLIATVTVCMLSGCDLEVGTHTHTYEEGWSYDANEHWHAASCTHTSQRKDKTFHTFSEPETVPATCAAAGSETRVCTTCGYVETKTLPALAHTLVNDPAKAPTCTEAGSTYGCHCSVCQAVITEATVIPATGHTEVTDQAVAPTCSAAGLTEGVHCSVCQAVLTAQSTVPQLPHTPVTDQAVPATCESDGLTEGSHCEVCQTVITAQTLIPRTNHMAEWERDETHHWRTAACTEHAGQRVNYAEHDYADITVTTPATCLAAGEGTARCVCGAQKTVAIPQLAHTPVIDRGYPATDTTTGLTDGKHCSVCQTVITAQQVIPYLGVTVRYMYDGQVVYTQTVNKVEGFSAAWLAERDAIRYTGFGFAGWYLDRELRTPYTFTELPTETLVLYGDRGQLAGANITYELQQSLTDPTQYTLRLCGSGDMFDYLYYQDVPWYTYRLSITDIVFEGNITSIGACAFYEFYAIDRVTLPEGIRLIGDNAFYASSLSDINFPSTVRAIGSNSFFRCDNLEHLNFNQGLVDIGKGAFYECSGIRTVVLTNEIGEFGGSAFFQTTNLTSVYYVGTREQYDKIIIRLDNFWVDQLANTYFLSAEKPTDLGLTPGPYWHYDGEGNICQWYYTIWYMESRDAKVPFVRDYVDATLGVQQCNLDFQQAITYHGYRFARWLSKTTTWKEYTLKVGDKVAADFRLVGDRGNLCGDSLTWTGNNGVLTISGTGRMWDFETVRDAPWYTANNKRYTKIVIGDQVTYIGSYAFVDLTSESFVSLEIPVNVTEIHPDAFSNCLSLRYLYYMGSAEQMAKVEGLSQLRSLLNARVYAYAPTGDMGGGAYWRTYQWADGHQTLVNWYYESATGTITVGGSETMFNYDSVVDTPWYALRDKLTTVIIQPGITTVGHNSFTDFASVTAITLPDTVTRISASAFSGTGYYTDDRNLDEHGVLYINNHLIKATRPATMPTCYAIRSGTVSVAEKAFDGCDGVTALVLPHSMRGIYSTGMTGLVSLERLYYTGTQMAFENIKLANLPEELDVYYYEYYRPTAAGQYWHYNDSGAPEVWDTNSDA